MTEAYDPSVCGEVTARPVPGCRVDPHGRTNDRGRATRPPPRVEGDGVKAGGAMDDHDGDRGGDDPATVARLAHERHDQVIQQLFATGLGLQAALPRIGDPEVRERVAQSVVALDRIIHEMRATMTELRAPR